VKALPTLRQLRYLVAIAEHRHFARAARDCNVTQSTLSAGIRELETILGVSLVGRSKRFVALTPVGEDVLARGRDILRRAGELVDAAHAGAAPLSGLLRLGVIPTIAPYLLPRALPELRQAYPALRLYLREDQTARLLTLLERGRIDAALIALPYESDGLQTAVLGSDRLLLACPLDHPFARRDSVAIAELPGQPLLLLEDGHCLRDHALTACGFGAGRSNEDFLATSMGTLIEMVASGLGITFIPELAVEVEAGRERGVAIVALDGGMPRREIALAWLPANPRAADFRRLAAAFARHVTAGSVGDARTEGEAASPGQGPAITPVV
jgi:LysR family hydrogen peroxide-inducible transcriptional activator